MADEPMQGMGSRGGLSSKRRHARRKGNYHLSSRPRDIAGSLSGRVEYDERDRAKYLAVEFTLVPYEAPDKALPPIPQQYPNNQGKQWYLRRAMYAASRDRWGDAYWYFTKAIARAKSNSERTRYAQSAEANLNSWRYDRAQLR